jgi:adenylate kinase family enzyme
MKLCPCAIQVLKEINVETAIPIRAIHVRTTKGRSLEVLGGESKPHLVLIRGLPGSGKSTLAGEFEKSGFRHFEADRYFIRNGIWLLDKAKLPEAHLWCENLAIRTLDFGQNVVVSNTFSRLHNLARYLKLKVAKSVLVVETAGEWQNIHGVTIDEIKKMSKKWEAL